MASVRSARLPSYCASVNLRRDRTYMIGMVRTPTKKPSNENSAPGRVQSFQPAAATT
jgi:hypothetical protein